jgi:hypothetical protein
MERFSGLRTVSIGEAVGAGASDEVAVGRPGVAVGEGRTAVGEGVGWGVAEEGKVATGVMSRSGVAVGAGRIAVGEAVNRGIVAEGRVVMGVEGGICAAGEVRVQLLNNKVTSRSKIESVLVN